MPLAWRGCSSRAKRSGGGVTKPPPHRVLHLVLGPAGVLAAEPRRLELPGGRPQGLASAELLLGAHGPDQISLQLVGGRCHDSKLRIRGPSGNSDGPTPGAAASRRSPGILPTCRVQRGRRPAERPPVVVPLLFGASRCRFGNAEPRTSPMGFRGRRASFPTLLACGSRLRVESRRPDSIRLGYRYILTARDASKGRRPDTRTRPGVAHRQRPG